MKGIAQKLLVGTSVLIGTIATSAPALAASLSNVQMVGTDYGVYGAADAITALTDSDRYSHVELNIADEILSNNNTGFTGNLGSDSIKVEGINQADWDGGLGTQWMADFTAAYPAVANATYGPISIGQIIAGEIQTAIGRSGDPNVAYLAKDDGSGNIEMDLIGHYNVWDAPWVANYSANPIYGPVIAGLKAQTPLLQISEIAKVTINGEAQYAYSFSAENTGVVAVDDGVSHSGRYTVSLAGTVEEDPADVPEPSIILGLMTVGGLFSASKRKSQNA